MGTKAKAGPRRTMMSEHYEKQITTLQQILFAVVRTHGTPRGFFARLLAWFGFAVTSREFTLSDTELKPGERGELTTEMDTKGRLHVIWVRDATPAGDAAK